MRDDVKDALLLISARFKSAMSPLISPRVDGLLPRLNSVITRACVITLHCFIIHLPSSGSKRALEPAPLAHPVHHRTRTHSQSARDYKSNLKTPVSPGSLSLDCGRKPERRRAARVIKCGSASFPLTASPFVSGARHYSSGPPSPGGPILLNL